MTLEAILWKHGKLQILDQLLLPHQLKYINIINTDDGWKAINKMQVRGAPAIAIVGCLSLAAELKECDSFEDLWDLHEFICSKLQYLITARPTAVNMAAAAEDLTALSELLASTEFDAQNMIDEIVSRCEQMLVDDVMSNKLIGDYGMAAILKPDNVPDSKNISVITHCNTGSLATAGYGTALGVVRSLWNSKRLEHVYCTETRPYNQGARLTAYELVYEKIPGTLICDSMVAALMRSNKVDVVVVGADRVAKNGDTANKIGTYQLAVVAKHHGIPFYVCAPTTSIDLDLINGQGIPIEDRPDSEMTHIAGHAIAAPGIACWNPAFDVTPAELITGGIVTEKGVFQPSDLHSKLSS